MTLEHTRPPGSLAIELREVARDAGALMEVLNRGFNFPLPTGFPEDQLKDICKSLQQLPEGTAEGCGASLDYARDRLPAIRREYILSEELSSSGESTPALTRGEALDLKLGTLISSVTTALDEYRRLAAKETVPQSKPEASIAPPQGAIADAMVEAANLDTSIANAQASVEAVVRPESRRADDLKRQLRDARGLNRLAFAEIRMPRVVVSWLRKSVDALKDYPKLIRKTTNGLRIATDILGIGLERWHEIERDLGRFVFDQMHRTWDALDKVAELLELSRRKGGGTAKLPDGFDLGEARRVMLAGRAPPVSWWPFITQLDFSYQEGRRFLASLPVLTNLESLNLRFTPVIDVTALAGLTNLQSLDLRDTQVSDVTKLAGLTKLQSLDLWGTKVSDVTALAGLTRLQSLDLWGTQVSDVTALAGLTDLQSLDLSHTQVSDVTALAGLTDLQSLDLSHTQVSDVTKVAGLTKLQSLDLSHTKASDVSVLAGLTNLEILNLVGTPVSDVMALATLTNLQWLNLSGTQVNDVTALAGLTNLEYLYLRGTQVSDVTALAGLSNLRSLDLEGTQVSDVVALAGLTNLKTLNLRGTRVINVAVLKHIKGLQIQRDPQKKTSRRNRSPKRPAKRARSVRVR
jgi:Leucine-rich repeat (LRR) protein